MSWARARLGFKQGRWEFFCAELCCKLYAISRFFALDLHLLGNLSKTEINKQTKQNGRYDSHCSGSIKT